MVISLFNNPNVQLELLSIFSQFLNQSEFSLTRKQKIENAGRFFEINTPNNLENQKFMIMIRINLVMISLLLNKNKKDVEFYLDCLIKDINNENEAMNEFMMKFLLECEFLNILFFLIENNIQDVANVTTFIDILLNMSGNGVHYKDFIVEISFFNRFNVNIHNISDN